jgi:adenosylcobinamide kinase/adenosylcobinamide-phosphate guanylyltransferase
MKRRILVLGGARSGKSRHAEALAMKIEGHRIYVATAEVTDDEMRERIAAHRKARDGKGWETVEEPLGLPAALMRLSKPDTVVLVDCLTLWLNNILFKERPVTPAIQALCSALDNARGTVILVSNETGLGIVPDNAAARAFQDAAGILNQRVAELAEEVIFMAAGLPMTLKGGTPPPRRSRRGATGRGRKGGGRV